MSRIPLSGDVYTCTTPGFRCVPMSITFIPYTLGKSRSALGSLHTAFWAHTTGVPHGIVLASRSSTGGRSWDFTEMITTSPTPNTMSPGSVTTGSRT